MEFLSAASGGNEFGSNPFRPRQTGFPGSLDYFPILVLRDSSGYKFPPLFLFGKRRSANFASGLRHGFLSFLGGGVWSNFLTASSKLRELKLGIMVTASFFFNFEHLLFIATVSLSAPRDARGFWFNKVIVTLIFFVPSYHLPIG